MAETLGSLLRQKRESLGLTLEKVERFTHIRVKHLQAIESDDLSSIPSVPQARGFIHNYASFLGVNPEEITAKAGSTKPRISKHPPKKAPPVSPPAGASPPEQPPGPVSSTQPRAPITAPVISRSAEYAKPRPGSAASRGRRWFRLDWLLVAAVTLVILGFLGWGGYYAVLSMTGPAVLESTEPLIPIGSAAAGTPSPEALFTDLEAATPAPDGTEATASTTEAFTPEITIAESLLPPGTVSVPTLSPTAFPTPLGGIYTDVRIHIVVLQRTYLEVVVDGTVKSPGRVLPGETYDFIGKQTVTVSTGNGGGIRVVFNGVDEGVMGRFGELVARTYTPAGAVTPVPKNTATPTVTPTPTRTTNP
jgi:cytoskeleton protein RodZ